MMFERPGTSTINVFVEMVTQLEFRAQQQFDICKLVSLSVCNHE